jgi:hypothetical protein
MRAVLVDDTGAVIFLVFLLSFGHCLFPRPPVLPIEDLLLVRCFFTGGMNRQKRTEGGMDGGRKPEEDL